MTILGNPSAVTLEGVKGNVDVNTGDGSVRVAGAPTALRAHTGDGSVSLDLDEGTTVGKDWEITTGDGGVSLYLSPDIAADLDVRTGDGRISNDLDVAGALESDKRGLRGKLGAGGKLIRVRTGDGSIKLRRY